MAEIVVREDESFEHALRRFKKAVGLAGILAELKRREHATKPNVRRRKKAANARKRQRRALQRAGA